MLHVGVDVHKYFSRVEVLDEQGKSLDRRRLAHPDKSSIRAYFEGLPSPMMITMESTRNWYWLYELLEEFGEVQLANPSKVRLIAEAKVKTDKVDARTLAHLERTGFLPTAYIPSRAVRDRRELYRYRISLVTIRTGLRNRIHALLDKLGIFHSNSDLFGLRGRQFLASLELRDHYQKVLDGYLQLHDRVDEAEKAVRREIKKTIQEDPRAKHLMTIPGIGNCCLMRALFREPGRVRIICGKAVLGGKVTSTSSGRWWRRRRKRLTRIPAWQPSTTGSGESTAPPRPASRWPLSYSRPYTMY